MSTELMFDRVPPQNLEAEQAVIGAILLQSEALITAMERVRSDDFYSGPHRQIYEAMVEIAENNQRLIS